MFSFFFKILKKIFGTQNDRELSKLQPIVDKVNALEQEMEQLTDEQLREKLQLIKKQIKTQKNYINSDIEKIRESINTSSSDQEKNKYKKKLKELKNSILNDRIPEVFAIVREASKRTIGLRHYDVQLMGGIVLHQGKIVEMTTGEGKTLVATLPVCLNALTQEGVYIITVNDYLAKRDSEYMGRIYKFLGFTVGVIQNDMTLEQKKQVYKCDIVYGTNNEFGFDYLRDNMVVDKEDVVQRSFSFAIVDEVDSILIDEARTPLIISGPVDKTNDSYVLYRPVVQEIVRAQKKLVREYLIKFKEEITKQNKDEAGKLLYLIHKAEPKNRDFLDIILKDSQAKTLFDKTQSLMDGKIMEKERNVLLEDLFFVFDEKSKDTTFNSRAESMMKERFNIEFMLEDIELELSKLTEQEITDEEKVQKETELVAKYTKQQETVESIKQLLKAYILFDKDIDYVVKDDKIIIVDSFTGRMMPGRRFSDGIHEAIEAKEQVEVQRESQTLATITLQNYFRMYDKLAGMTGTAKTEEGEFESIYLLSVIQIPTNRPLQRENMSDRIYKTEREKFNAVVNEIVSCYEKGRPILVGTISIQKSEELSKLLNSKGIKHNVLNAKYHEKEANIIAQAGSYKAVTIATNMAGRGTDILLGGSAESLAQEEIEKLKISDQKEKEEVFKKFLKQYEEKIKEKAKKVIDLGGLHVCGTERHESRRIDNQLRGRSGRQGDPGSSRFYLSLEDDLMRIFGSDRIKSVMDRLGMEEGEVIENPLVTRAIRTAQKRVEGQNFEIRKHLLKYDNVMNQQREVIYKRRQMILNNEDLKKEFFESLLVGLETIFEQWDDSSDIEKIEKDLMYLYAIKIDFKDNKLRSAKDMIDYIVEHIEKNYELREKIIGKNRIREIEKMVMLSVIDLNWKEYLREIDELREGIYWRAYAQKDPLIEFQHEAFRMFRELIIKIDEQIAEKIMKVSAMEEQYKKGVFQISNGKFEHKQYSSMENTAKENNSFKLDNTMTSKQKIGSYKRDIPKVGRNDSCPCGSGKKYKKCCGQ